MADSNARANLSPSQTRPLRALKRDIPEQLWIRSATMTVRRSISAWAAWCRQRNSRDVHHFGEQLLIKTAPIHTDPNRLALIDRHLDDGAEVVVAPRV